MPPKNKFTREEIIEAAFTIAKDEGFAAITARSVAKKLGCSVAPIYVNFDRIDDLLEAVVQRVQVISQEMFANQDGESFFENLGKASLQIAREYPVLVRELILQPNPHMESYEVMEEAVLAELAEDENLRDWTQKERRHLFFTMRVVQTGLITLVANGHLPKWLPEDEIEELLIDIGNDLVSAQKIKREESN